MNNVQTLKGFRDFLPETVRKRQYVLEILRKVFESYGFEPLETPALEYQDVLNGKYGAEGDKLMYKFKDNGDRNVAMRYDQTVPLARVVSQYQNELPLPFKRYQMQNVWRAENTQKGRYREFLQVDADIVGSYSPLADAEVIAVTAKCLEKLGFKDFYIMINDRKSLNGYFKTSFNIPNDKIANVIRIIDKLKKIGTEGVTDELITQGFTNEEASEIQENIRSAEESSGIVELQSILNKDYGLNKDIIKFSPSLARGLEYYTGIIFEVEVEGYDAGSIAGGGRYDNLIGLFLPAGRQVPAVGFSFGFDRTLEAMESLDLFPKNLKPKDILVAFSTSDLQEKALRTSQKLRDMNINAEIYLEDATLEKQLKYANKKQIPYVLIVNDNNFILKNMTDGNQKEITQEQLPNEFK